MGSNMSLYLCLNYGYQMHAYLASATGQIFFIYEEWREGNPRKLSLNLFYLLTALIGVRRWWKVKGE